MLSVLERNGAVGSVAASISKLCGSSPPYAPGPGAVAALLNDAKLKRCVVDKKAALAPPPPL